jgi:hypothetical protein
MTDSIPSDRYVTSEAATVSNEYCDVCGRYAPIDAVHICYGPHGTTATATNAPRSLTFADIERVARDLQSLPKGKWMLVAPDGRMWQDESPRKIAQAAAMEALLAEPFAPIAPPSTAQTPKADTE